jgi:hypothetical protein
MKRTSSTHRWRIWYDRSVASRGKDGQCLRASPEGPTLFGADGLGDQLHGIGCCIEGAAWPAPSIRCVLPVGMVDASERLRRTMLLGLREPSAVDKITWCVVDAIRTAGRGRPVLQIRNLRPGL